MASPRIAYLNGEYLPLDQARISPLDRGFLFADGIYEVWPVLGGRPIDNAPHMARLQRSCREIELDLPEPPERIAQRVQELIDRNAIDEGLVYLQVTRGVADRDFVFPPAGTPATLFMFTQVRQLSNPAAAETGIAVLTVPDQRWARRDIKSVGLLAQALAKQAALRAGCQEAWMVENGLVTEGASSTAFIIDAGGALITRAESQAVLPGCTRLAVLALAAEGKVHVELRPFTVAEALQSREAFITSAGNLIQPVVTIDRQPIADGRPGPLTRRLRELYLEIARRPAN